MFGSILALTCMYGALVPLACALVLFVVRKSYLDFYPEHQPSGGSDESNGGSSEDINVSSNANCSENNQSGSSDTQSHPLPRATSYSASKSAKWAASEIDSVMCGLNRWGYFVFTTDSAIITCCLCTFTSAVILLLMFTSVAPCYPSGPTVASIYQISKGSMYFLFFNRVDNIFSDTPFAYSKLVIRSLMIFNFCVSLCLSIATVVFIKADSIKTGGLTWCLPLMPPLLGMSIISFDILMSGISMRMFISPLKKIYAMELESEMSSVGSMSSVSSLNGSDLTMKATKKEVKRGSQVRRIAVKCRLLTLTAIVSTFLMFSVAVLLDFGDLVVWDMIINNLSVIFMTTWVDDYYETVCFIPLKIEWSLKKVCSAIKQ